MNKDDIIAMDRFEIFNSKKSLYERAIRYIREGRTDEGIKTLELLLDADPEHEDAKKKLIEIYGNKIISLTKADLPADGLKAGEPVEAQLSEPTELERSEGSFYLSQTSDALLTMIGQSTTQVFGAEFSPETAKRKGLEWFESVREELKNIICSEWSYCEKRNDRRFRDKITLAAAIAQIISSSVEKLPPLAVSSLLLKIGLDDFCECQDK